MEYFNYRDMGIVSLNIAGWNWRNTNEKWDKRLKKACLHIKNKTKEPFIIAFQEVQLSGGKYLTVLEEQFPDYHIVLPDAYENQPRSIVSLLLINKRFCKSYNIITLQGLEKSLRYNFVTINTHIEGLCFRILNIHVPHNCLDDAAEWYKEEREDLRALFIKRVEEVAASYRSEADLKLIVLGDLNSSPEDIFIKSLAHSYKSPMVETASKNRNNATWNDLATGTEKKLDYILYSKGMLCNTGVRAKLTDIDNSVISENLSDHAMLIGGILLS